MRKILRAICLLPLGLCLIILAVANRGFVSLSFDPLSSSEPFFAIKAPLFVLLFVALIIGVLIGGFSTWLTQSKYRKSTRVLGRETAKLKADIADVKAKNNASLPQIV